MIVIKKKHFGQGNDDEHYLPTVCVKSSSLLPSRRQVALADVVLLNKIDLISHEDKQKLLDTIR
jgi:G3E family GTPase